MPAALQLLTCLLLASLPRSLDGEAAGFPLLEPWLEEARLPGGGAKSESQQPVHPVILVPGYMGSQLLYDLDRDSSTGLLCPRSSNGNLWTLWLSLANHDPVRVRCWMQYARMSYDRTTRRSLNADGVTVQPKAFGSTLGIEFVSPMPEQHPETVYFYNLVRALEAIGYTKDFSLRGAPYDWRLAYHENEAFQSGFKELVESTFRENRGKPVVVICHSMGCTFTYSFFLSMSPEWRDQFLKSWIVVGAPMGGTFKYMYGYFADDDYPTIPGVRAVERSLSSHAFLLPRPATYGDDVLVQSLNREYTANSYEQFFQDLDQTDAYNMFLDSKDAYDDSSLRLPGNFSIVCVGGVGQATLEKAVIAGDLAPGARWTGVYGDGDRFVNRKSMRRCLDFGVDRQDFTFKELRADHMDLIRGAEAIAYLTSILNQYNDRQSRDKVTPVVWPFVGAHLVPL